MPPSPASRILDAGEFLPKLRLLQSIVGEVIGRPADDAATQRGVFMLIGPIMMLCVGEQDSLRRAFPAIGGDRSKLQAMADQMCAFMLAGLRAEQA